MTTNTPERRIKRAAARSNDSLIRLDELLTEIRDLAPAIGAQGVELNPLKEAKIHLRMMGDCIAEFTKAKLGMGPEQLESYK